MTRTTRSTGSGNSDILGMEDVYQWKLRSGVAPGNSTNHTQGSFSVSLTNPGTTELQERSVRADGDAAVEHHDRLLHPDGRGDGQRVHVRRLPEQGVCTRFIDRQCQPDRPHAERVQHADLPTRCRRARSAARASTSACAVRLQVRSRHRHLPARQHPRPGRRAGDAAAEPRVRGPAHRAVALVPHRRRGVLPAGPQASRPARRSAPTRTSTRTGC